MTRDPQQLARLISAETGLPFSVREDTEPKGDLSYLFQPIDALPSHSFAVRLTIGWRRITLEFEPGTFAGELLAAMGKTDDAGRIAFRTVLDRCSRLGAEIKFIVNDTAHKPHSEDAWHSDWSRLSLILKTRIQHENEIAEIGNQDVLQSLRLFVAAIMALLPLEQDETEDPPVMGFAEGGAAIQQSIRYERDRRNRAAAIAIWGCNCQACGLDFGERYGDVARGYIEVHHTTPVSALQPGTIVDPAKDLVPLCPNCHAVAHRRDPPFTIQEVRGMLGLIQSSNTD